MRTASSHVQMKALFFILLLAGHDAVRVTQEVEWSKSKWNELHADCSWSLLKGCSEGCVRKRLPLDLTPAESCRHTNAYLLENNGLENYHAMIEILMAKSEKYSESCQKASRWNRRCARREAQMTEAFQFIIRAFVNEKFMDTVDESERTALSDGFAKVLKNLANSQGEAESMAELFKKMKCQQSELLRDPKKALSEVTGLAHALLSDNKDAKQQAKLQIEAMPETCRPVSAEEEAEGLVKLKDLQKESEQERGEASLVLDELDAATDHVVEEEAETDSSAGSALQVNHTSTEVMTRKMSDNALLSLLMNIALTGALTSFLLIAGGPAGWVALFAAGLWAISSVVYCFWSGLLTGKLLTDSCVKPVFLFPFKPVIFVVKGVLKGAARLGKGIYKHIKGNTSSTSVHQNETTVLDDPLELQKVLDEASVS